MGKNKGDVPCALCDRTFASIAHCQQHARDKHPNSPTQAWVVQPQTPAQEPQAQVQTVPTPIPAAPSLETIICEHCLASFPSSKALKQHKISSHSWRCMKCPTLPPFENGTAWQIHFNEMHAASAITDTKERKVATSIEADRPAQFVLDDPERSKGFHCGEDSGQHRDANGNPSDIKVHSVATQLERSVFGAANVKGLTSSPPPEMVGLGVILDEVASDDRVGKSKSTSSNLTRGSLGFLTSKNPEDRTVRVDERDPLSSEEPTLNILVEIDPEPHRGRGETAYEIASDISSPTTTVSAIGNDEPEGEDDIEFPLHSFGLLNGSSLEKERDINAPPRGPKLGDRKGNTWSNATVARNRSGGEMNVQAFEQLSGITPSIADEEYKAARSGSPNSAVSSSRDEEWAPNQGDLPHDPLRTRRSKTESTTAMIHFKCRICLSDPTPTSNLTATHCGHLFCYECIATDVLRTSRCPVCQNVLALYCLFKLDTAS